VSSTDGNGGTKAAAMVKGMLKRVCLQCESKGESGSSGSTLYSNRERERGGDTEGASGRRPSREVGPSNGPENEGEGKAA
jgi:hypothetical protein